MDVDERAEAKTAKEVQAFSPELLHLYYDRLFPFEGMFRWLSYGNDPASSSPHVDKLFFKRRELSFTLADDVYIRYRCFETAAEFREAVLKRDPHKMDIGPVFNASPDLHSSVTLKPEERELVFDIDMTDYDDVRNCCDGASICRACWPLMNAAIAVTDRALREDFGFQHLLWVYSGRRGVHCWVSDRRARHLTNDQRGKIVAYLHQPVKADDLDSLRALTPPLHPAVQRAYDVLEPYFRSVVCSPDRQAVFDRDQDWDGVLQWLPTDDLRKRVRRAWTGQADLDGEAKWALFKRYVNNAAKASGVSKVDAARLRAVPQQVVFHYLYPRLDVNVSKAMNHLLKSPWVAHPKTGRVCVPIDPERFDDFDPFAVPTLGQLQVQLNAAGAEAAAGGPRAVAATTLKPYMRVFDDFLRDLYASIRDERRKADAASLDF